MLKNKKNKFKKVFSGVRKGTYHNVKNELEALENASQIYWTFSEAEIKELEEQILTLKNNLRLVESVGENYWNYSQREIKTLEKRVKGLLWLTNNLNQQKIKKIDELDEEIDKLQREVMLLTGQINATEGGELWKSLQNAWNVQRALNQHINYYKNLLWQTDTRKGNLELELQSQIRKQQTVIQQLNGHISLLNQLAEEELKEKDNNTQQINQELQTQLNDLRVENTNLTTTINNYLKIIVDLKREKDALEAERNELVQGDSFQTNSEQRKYYRKQRSQRGRSIEWSDNQATLFGDEDDQGQGASTNPKNPDNQIKNSNWKSTFWQKTKKLGLIALTAYGSYQTGHYQGSNSCQTNQLSPIQPNSLPIAYNQTHSWIENPLTNTHCDLEPSNSILTFQNSDFSPPPPPHETNLLNELAQLRLRPNITQTEYERLKANQAPTNLPLDWEKQSAHLKELECRPTPAQLEKAVQAEKAKLQHLVDPATYRQDWINPTELETKAQAKGMVSLETYNLRPNITLDKYRELLKNQKPLDLPKDWEIKLTQLSELEKRPNISPEEFAKYKSPEQIKEIEKAIEDNNKLWTNKGLINPHNEADLISANLVKKDNLTVAEKERNNRPNITLTEWENDWSKRPTQNLHDQEIIAQHNQTKLDLEEKLLTKSAKIETLNSLLDTLKKKYGRIRSERNAYKNDLTSTRQSIRELEQEKNQALANVENFNQQLDNVQQELVRTKRKKRKLARKYQQEQTQHTKTQTKFQAQSSYLQNIFECLVSAGMGAKLGWKYGRMYEKGELEAKYLKDIQNGINTLIQQKNQAQKNQERAEKERDQAQSERDYYRWQMENHECASANTSQERIIQKQIETINNEQEIIQELNTTLHLGLENPTLKQVISKIQELIVKDPKSVDTPFGEDLEVIKNIDLVGLEQELNILLSPQVKEQIKKATNYQELSFLRNKEIKSYLEKGQNNEITTLPNQQTIRPFEKERIFWLILLGISLLTIGGLLAKMKGLSQRKKKAI